MRRIALPLVAVIFLFSGIFALVYEITWARMLAREFGSDAVAIAIVVSVFMLGLGVGARLAGIRGDAFRNPLRVYGFLEVGLGLYVLASPWLIGGFMPLLAVLGEQGVASPWLLNSTRTLLGMTVLLLPTLIMGASLPLLVRFAVDVAERIPAAVIGLYAINIVGAVAGVLLAGFWLLPVIGMSTVLLVIGAANVALGLAAIGLSRSVAEAHRGRRPSARPDPGPAERSAYLKLMSAVVLLGVASMVCQLAWTRVIVLIVGGSAYAFSSVLAVFLAGLGLGAGLAAVLLRWFGHRAMLLFGISGVLAALTVFVSTIVLPFLPGVFLMVFDAELAASRVGLLNLQTLIAAALFLVPVTFMGMMFPLALRIGLGDFDRPAADTGRLYLGNAMGCVAGALLAGFILIPSIGILASLLLAVGLMVYAVIVVQSLHLGQRAQVVLVLVLFAGYGSSWFVVPPWNAQLMASGLSEYARAYQQVSHLPRHLARNHELLFYRDGPTATVTVSRDLASPDRNLFIATNGKTDGSSHGDMPTQRLSAHLSMLLHPGPREVAVIGMGTGATAGSAALHPEVERVVVVEIEPAMIEGSRLFAEHNHEVHDNPLVDILVTDGRLYLFMAEQAFDIIISEPSNPWIAGTASLFTREYYEFGARALRPGGIFAQWVQVYDMDWDNVRSVIRTFQEVFPHTYLAVTIMGADLILIGSGTPLDIDPQAISRRMAHSAVAADMADPRVGVHDHWQLLSRIWLTPDDLAGLTPGVRIHRDDWPFLMYEAPLSRYLDSSWVNMERLSAAAGGLLTELAEGGLPASDAERLRQAYLGYVPAPYRWPALVPTVD